MSPTERCPATSDQLLDMHRRMVRIRHFEEEAGKLTETGKIPGALHLYVGEEAVAAGVMVHLSDADQITSTHRGHGHIIAKGGDFRLMYAELFGKATGYCRGKGGSMHISDLELGVLGANGIVAGSIPIAVGAAFANRYRNSDLVTVCFFGDGASNEGAFHEAANMAALYRLPVIFLCENNLYGEFTSQDRHQAIVDVADRASGYGMPGVIVDGMDALAVFAAAGECISRARRGEGPSLVECKTYRFYDHVGVTGMRIPYRDEAEVDTWKARDPIAALELHLVERGVIEADAIAAVHREVLDEIADAIAFAEASALPDVAALTDDVYSNPILSGRPT
jgi:acetoin:2,6-dichlorophenolindophenol oxidoreductase subunit alpha